MDIDSIKGNHPDISNIYLENDDNYKKDMKTFIQENKIEYWIIIDEELDDEINDELDNGFIKKGLLHYQYLNKNVSISNGKNKFELGLEDDFHNKIINKCNLDYLDEKELKIDTYYI